MRRTSVSRLIHASREAVYRAFTEATSVATWLPPNSMKATIERFDAREGGEFRVTLTYVGEHPVAGKTTDQSDVVVGRFVELTPGERIVWTTRFESGSDAYEGEMIVAFALSNAGDATRITCTCENIPPGITLEDNEAGTAQSLDNLAAYVEAP